jgi:riboflavin synthase
MFTGIVQELGEIRERLPAGKAIRFSFQAPMLSGKLKVGDSVACDGVCLTVEQNESSGFSVCAVPETLVKTTLGGLKAGDIVNLESALTTQDPLGGHFVLGHVDGVCEIISVKTLASGEGCEITVRLPEEFLPYCVYKGSLALSGVSLTIAAIEGDSLRFALIPHTLNATNLGRRVKLGTRLNFEVDILSKYVERQLAFRASPGVSEFDLEKWGYGTP